MLSFRMQRYNISSEYASISVKKTYFPALKTENKFLHTQTTHNIRTKYSKNFFIISLWVLQCWHQNSRYLLSDYLQARKNSVKNKTTKTYKTTKIYYYLNGCSFRWKSQDKENRQREKQTDNSTYRCFPQYYNCNTRRNRKHHFTIIFTEYINITYKKACYAAQNVHFTCIYKRKAVSLGRQISVGHNLHIIYPS